MSCDSLHATISACVALLFIISVFPRWTYWGNTILMNTRSLTAIRTIKRQLDVWYIDAVEPTIWSRVCRVPFMFHVRLRTLYTEVRIYLLSIPSMIFKKKSQIFKTGLTLEVHLVPSYLCGSKGDLSSKHLQLSTFCANIFKRLVEAFKQLNMFSTDIRNYGTPRENLKKNRWLNIQWQDIKREKNVRTSLEGKKKIFIFFKNEIRSKWEDLCTILLNERIHCTFSIRRGFCQQQRRKSNLRKELELCRLAADNDNIQLLVIATQSKARWQCR